MRCGTRSSDVGARLSLPAEILAAATLTASSRLISPIFKTLHPNGQGAKSCECGSPIACGKIPNAEAAGKPRFHRLRSRRDAAGEDQVPECLCDLRASGHREHSLELRQGSPGSRAWLLRSGSFSPLSENSSLSSEPTSLPAVLRFISLGYRWCTWHHQVSKGPKIDFDRSHGGYSTLTRGSPSIFMSGTTPRPGPLGAAMQPSTRWGAPSANGRAT